MRAIALFVLAGLVHAESNGALQGKVRLHADLQVDAVHVYALRVAGDQPPADERILAAAAHVRVRSGESYRFDNLAAGRYAVALSVDGLTLESVEILEVKQDTVEKSLRLRFLKPRDYRIVRVLRPDGRPVEWASFSCRYRAKTFSGVGPCEVSRRKDGSYIVRPMDWMARGAGEGGKHTLTIGTRRHGALREVWDPAVPRALVVRLAKPASVDIKLTRYVGGPHVGRIHVAVKREAERDWQTTGHPVDAWGNVEVGPVQAGDAEILIGTKKRLLWIVKRVPVRLKPGLNRVRVALPQLHPLTIKGKPDLRFYVTVAGALKDVYIRYERTNLDGKVVLPRLAAGDYVIHAHGKKIPVSVPHQSVVVLPGK